MTPRAHAVIACAILTACTPASPIDTPLRPAAAEWRHDPEVRDAAAPDVHHGPARGNGSMHAPDAGEYGDAGLPEPSRIVREICDGFDNDGDGLVDERVTNRCGECGPLPLDVADGADNDCDGVVDEGHLGASCAGDADCLDPLACQDGRCRMGCGVECDVCAECIDRWEREDGQPVLFTGCVEACATCAGWCGEVGGWCHGGECRRDAQAVGCPFGDGASAAVDVSWFADGRLVVETVRVCIP